MQGSVKMTKTPPTPYHTDEYEQVARAIAEVQYPNPMQWHLPKMKTQWCSWHESTISPVLMWQPAFCRSLNACKDQGGCTNATSPVQLVVNYPCRSRYTGPKADGLHHT